MKASLAEALERLALAVWEVETNAGGVMAEREAVVARARAEERALEAVQSKARYKRSRRGREQEKRREKAARWARRQTWAGGTGWRGVARGDGGE